MEGGRTHRAHGSVPQSRDVRIFSIVHLDGGNSSHTDLSKQFIDLNIKSELANQMVPVENLLLSTYQRPENPNHQSSCNLCDEDQ